MNCSLEAGSEHEQAASVQMLKIHVKVRHGANDNIGQHDDMMK